MEDVFSETEQEVIKLLGKRRISIKDLTMEFYRGKEKPLNPANVVAGIVLRINKKCEYYKLPWFINGQGLGRGGRTVWKDKAP